MVRLELKLRNLENFVIRLKDITTEEMIVLCQAIGEMKKKYKKLKKERR